MNSKLFYISFLVLLSSCGGDPWSNNEKSEFINGCIDEGGKRRYCDCFMKNTMEKYPRYEDSHDISFEEAVELSKDCK
ncbi:MAG: hypothetical protein R2780_07020 [Crocinitomicaceae bacterium]|nr:hypothetical protein [Crocinitomicaceae bacterium]